MAFYTDSQRQIQEQHDSQNLAVAMELGIVKDEIEDRHVPFIESRDFFFLSTVNGRGEPTVSHKGGDVGTVRVLDSKTLAFPMYDGNGMFLSMGNIAETAKIGLLFIDFETPNRVRVQATASLTHDAELLASYPGAIGVVLAKVDQTFINCARYIHKHDRRETSRYVPDEAGEQPYASWKRIDDLQDFLPEKDQGRAADEGGVITEREYGTLLQSGES